MGGLKEAILWGVGPQVRLVDPGDREWSGCPMRVSFEIKACKRRVSSVCVPGRI